MQQDSAATAHTLGQLQPEILAALAAAATVFLRKRTRVLSARLLTGAQHRTDAWARQGRIIVQTSHNLRRKS